MNDLDVFIDDFGVDVVSDNGPFRAVFDMPDELLSDGIVVSTDYKITAKSSDVGALRVNDKLYIDNETYYVRVVRKIDDGKFSLVGLSKGDL